MPEKVFKPGGMSSRSRAKASIPARMLDNTGGVAFNAPAEALNGPLLLTRARAETFAAGGAVYRMPGMSMGKAAGWYALAVVSCVSSRALVDTALDLLAFFVENVVNDSRRGSIRNNSRADMFAILLVVGCAFAPVRGP